MSQAQEMQQRLDEVKSLRERLSPARWQEEDWGILDRVLGSYERLLATLFEAQITRKRLQTLLFGKRRLRRHPSVAGASVASGSEAGSEGEAGRGEAGGHNKESSTDARPGSGVGASDDAVKATRSGGHRPGHGRLEAEAYAGAERVACRHEALAVGERCPVCGQGRLYRVPPGVEIRIDGNALRNHARMPHCLRWGGMASLLGGLGDRFPQHNRCLLSKSPAACGGDLYWRWAGLNPIPG